MQSVHVILCCIHKFPGYVHEPRIIRLEKDLHKVIKKTLEVPVVIVGGNGHSDISSNPRRD